MHAGKEDEKKVNIHIMHSMKGGCGKSTCALFKALQIAQEQDISDRHAHVLFLDADFKGSAMMKLLFDRSGLKGEDARVSEGWEKARKLRELEGAMKGDGMQHIMAIPDNIESYQTVSDYLRDHSRCTIGDIICHSCSYQTEEKNPAPGEVEKEENVADSEQSDFVNGYVDFILSSPSSDSKDWFRYKQGKIAAGVYSYRMDALIQKILDIGVVNEEGRGLYSDIVIDMPPGYDEYSDILMDLLRATVAARKNIRLHYYAITTEDIGHKALTVDNINKMKRDSTENAPFSSVNLVLNAASPEDFSVINATEKKEYHKWVELEGVVKGKVYVNEYSESYHAFCRKGNVGKFDEDINAVLKEN